MQQEMSSFWGLQSLVPVVDVEVTLFGTDVASIFVVVPSEMYLDCVMFIVSLKAISVVIVEKYFVGSVDVSFSYDV